MVDVDFSVVPVSATVAFLLAAQVVPAAGKISLLYQLSIFYGLFPYFALLQVFLLTFSFLFLSFSFLLLLWF